MGTGCKVLLIVGIVLLAIIVGGAILIYNYGDKVQGVAATKTVEQLEKDVMANLPEGANADEVKATLNELKDKVKKLIEEKKLDFGKMAPMIKEFSDSMKDSKIETEELTKLMDRIKEYINSN
ncbi:MAG: hypothetical protein WBP29_02530 [Candidatus Zixiibacteriota bacterium]